MGVLWDCSADLAMGLLSASLLPVCLLPPMHSSARSLVNPIVTSRVSRTLNIVKGVQRMEHPGLLFAILICNATVSTEFYVLLLSVLTWAGYIKVAWELGVLLSLALYFGNAIKDLVGAPRPFAVQGMTFGVKIKLQGGQHEAGNAVEHGLPSTHVINSLTIAMYGATLGVRSSDFLFNHQGLLLAVVITWVAWIGWGRLYCGMHSFIDLASGLFIGAIIFQVFLYFQAYLVEILDSGYSGLGKQILFVLLMLSVYPRPMRYTPSYEVAVTIMGGVFGLVFGYIILEGTYAHSSAFKTGFATFKWNPFELSSTIALGIRTTLGLFVMISIKVASKPLIFFASSHFLGLFPENLRKLWEPPIGIMFVTDSGAQSQQKDKLARKSDGTHWDVEISTRFLSYALLGSCCSLVCGLIFDFLKL